MEDSILRSTKKILGVGDDYKAFDLDIITHINSTLSILDQLGIGPAGGLMIDDDTVEWSELGVPQNQLNMVRTYMFLRVRMLFDPPTTSFLIDATKQQIEEHEQRLSWGREALVPYPVVEEV